ncbi:MAG: alpha/beta fold hydrolase [Dongiaceae bacterium]
MMQQQYFQFDEQTRIAYTEWGDQQNPRVLLCVHGLTRNSRDFDFLARALEKDFRLICPDIAGRGKSSWLADKTHYALPVYITHVAALLAQLQITQIDWIGTSMGGMMGIALAAYQPTLFRNLVINDIGPLIPQKALQFIADYAGQEVIAASLAEIKAELKKRHEGFHITDEGVWDHLVEHSTRQLEDGRYTLNYDTGIAANFRALAQTGPVDMWEIWKSCPTPKLLLRGENSPVLTNEIYRQVLVEVPHCMGHGFKHCGHAPALVDSEQIEVVKTWLLRTSP